MRKKIFVTGITGTVGYYIYDLLANNPDYELYLLIRTNKKRKQELPPADNVKIVPYDIVEINKCAALLKEMDYVVHLAAGWGNIEVNYKHTFELLDALDPVRCKKIIYFSTASILDSHNKIIEKLGEIGTSYIKGKYLCHQALPRHKLYDRIITLYPTWVLGGDRDHPYSHAMQGIKQLSRWLWLIRFISFELKFHFIHARDIALIADYLLKHDVAEREYVLGNPLITLDQIIDELCRYFKKRRYFKVRIPPSLIKFITFLFGKGLSAWDKYSLERRDFSHQVVNARTFGLESKHSTITQILRDLSD